LKRSARSPNPRQNRTVPPNPQTLAARPRSATLTELQHLLDEFTLIYNTERTHRALPAGTTPAQAYTARPKATPTGTVEHFRIRHDTVDQLSKTGYRLIASHQINPDKNYWPNKQKNPDQRPGNL
jgi:hypothetical protein